MDPVLTFILFAILITSICLAVLIFDDAMEKRNSFKQMHDLVEHFPKAKKSKKRSRK